MDKKGSRLCHLYRLSALLLLLTLPAACAFGRKSTSNDSVAKTFLTAQKLDKRYSRVLLTEFEVPAEIAGAYPEAALVCKVSAVDKLVQKNLYEEVGVTTDGKSYGQNTLLVKTKIEEMRLVSGATRTWAFFLAGSSYMTLDVELVDGGTGKVVAKQQLSTENDAFNASRTGGMSDSSLPSDMGAILADYIAHITPQ